MDLPLLVRGVPGSGRSLLCHYVEIFRSGRGPVLRLHGRDLREPEYLAHCLRESRENGQPPIRSVWIDEVDTLSVSTQNTLAEWIIHASSPEVVSATGLRWIATASAAGLHDRLEPSLERAFAPLVIQVPALGEHPETGGPVNVMDGRYGPYVKWEKVNATIPKGTEPADVTMEMAVELIAEKAAKKGSHRN